MSATWAGGPNIKVFRALRRERASSATCWRLLMQHHITLAEVVTGQWEAAERESVIKQTAQIDAQRYDKEVEIGIEQEPGSGGKESAQNTVKMLAGYPVFVDRVTGEKSTRWEPFIAQVQAGNVKMVSGLWNQL